MRLLFVIDMQQDFIRGVLGTREAEGIIENVKNKVCSAVEEGTPVIFTRDTHGLDYLDRQEGKLLPYPHCIAGTSGWEIITELSEYTNDNNTFDKPTFGSLNMVLSLYFCQTDHEPIDSIELCGVCTDICLISNALLLKSAFPEIPIFVDASCCAGTTPENHEAALKVMQSCQIKVMNKEA
ncbi:MAG: cysteine hydrolase [Bacteroidales bacterium]|nr:cysteine hydrolase [Bacteroidales bacterium]